MYKNGDLGWIFELENVDCGDGMMMWIYRGLDLSVKSA